MGEYSSVRRHCGMCHSDASGLAVWTILCSRYMLMEELVIGDKIWCLSQAPQQDPNVDQGSLGTVIFTYCRELHTFQKTAHGANPGAGRYRTKSVTL